MATEQELREQYELNQKKLGLTQSQIEEGLRLGQAKVDDMFDNPEKFKQRIDEEFYGITDYIVKTVDKDQWKSYNDQQRRAFIEKYFKEVS